MSFLTISWTYSYWQGIVCGNNTNSGKQITIGKWGMSKKVIRVHKKLSQSFDDFTFEIYSHRSLGLEFNDYFKFAGLDPFPLNHSGVDQSLYTFDNWYLSDGTVFDANTVIKNHIDVYPSWNKSAFSYTYANDSLSYTLGLADASAADSQMDFYVPGWRYHGREIGSVLASMSNINTVKNLFIGDGVKTLVYESFRKINADSLNLGEGIIRNKDRAFISANIKGLLVFPSIIVDIGTDAFTNGGFDGTLDLNQTHNLKPISHRAFQGNDFIGGLHFQEALETIGNNAFYETGFTGDIDFSKTVNLSTIGSSTFNKTGLTGTQKIAQSLQFIAAISFPDTKITILDLSDADSLERIDSNSFTNSRLTTIIFPTNGRLNTINNQSFQNTKLTGKLVFPSKL